jgi:hypothetical protein
VTVIDGPTNQEKFTRREGICPEMLHFQLSAKIDPIRSCCPGQIVCEIRVERGQNMTVPTASASSVDYVLGSSLAEHHLLLRQRCFKPF